MNHLPAMQEKPPAESIRYRPEIDGLRAVAVVAVVLFHAGLGVSGGYVGVDVFFVISGFLITSIIARELDSGKFTLRNFWTRRIRRILPASAAMVFIVAYASLVLLIPSDFERVMKSVLWQAVMMANYHFSQGFGYFAEQAELKPLLHTWSLAVEEQFYIFFPPFLLLYRRFIGKNLLKPIIFIAVASFVFSIWQLEDNASAAFYLLPSRSWELLAGSIAALLPRNSIKSKLNSEFISLAGLLLILYSCFAYTTATPFPGPTALVPVLGSLAIIMGCSSNTTLVTKILSWQPIVMTGRYSYSIYLWHWPIIAFANLLFIEISFTMRIFFVIASFILAIPSYYFVEQPFRKTKLLTKPKQAFRFAAIVIASSVLMSIIVIKTDGISPLTKVSTRELYDELTWTGGEYEQIVEGKKLAYFGDVASDEAKTVVNKEFDFLLWGDSHGKRLYQAFDQAASSTGLQGVGYCYPASAPVPEIWRGDHSRKESQTALRRNAFVKDYILENDIRNVVIACRWSIYCSGRNKEEVAERGVLQESGLVVDSNELTSVTPEISTEIMRKHLNQLLTELTAAGVEVWLIQQPPECASTTPARDFIKSLNYPPETAKKLLNNASVSREEHASRQSLANSVLTLSDKFPSVHRIDPSTEFFDEQGLLSVYSEKPYYQDSHHLTRFGADKFMKPCIEDILTEIKNKKLPLVEKDDP